MITEDANVICPLWKWRADKMVTCEGPVAGTLVTFRFNDRAEALKQREVFCCKHWLNCEITRMFLDNRKFEDI